MLQAPSPETLNRFVRWAIMLFLAYALWHGNSGVFSSSSKPLASAPLAEKREKDCDATASNPLTNFSLSAIPLLPSYEPALRINEIAVGDGAPAVCGQTATLRYEYLTHGNETIFSNQSSTEQTHLRIGGFEALRGLELGLIGMQPGGKRSITIPPDLAFAYTDIKTIRDNAAFTTPPKLNLQIETITANVSLLSLSPPTPVSTQPLRIINVIAGSGKRVECGDKVTAMLSLWKLDGTPLLTSANLTFTIGQSQVPYGIEKGVVGMLRGGLRTLIMPPAYAKPLVPLSPEKKSSLAPKIFSSGETVLVEITVMPAVENAAPDATSP